MTCPRCKSEIAEGTLICPVCGDWCAASAQKERVDALKAERKNIVHRSFRSTLFMVMAALMTSTAVLNLFSCFTVSADGNGVQFSFNFIIILYVICAVFCWQAYSSTNPNQAADHLRRVSVYDAAIWIIGLVGICVLGLCLLICLPLIAVADEVLAESWAIVEEAVVKAYGSTDVLAEVEAILSLGAGFIIAIFAVIIAVATAVLVWLMIISLKRRKYLKNTAENIEHDKYDIEKNPPYVSAIVYSAIGIFTNLTSALSAIASGGLSFITIIAAISLDCYIIVSAVWMSRLHKDELANNAEIERESAILNNLIYSSKIAYENQTKTEESEKTE